MLAARSHYEVTSMLPCAELGPIQFAEKPNVPFKLLGFTDMNEDDFVYFKTPGGSWVAAAEDDLGRMFMIDQVHVLTQRHVCGHSCAA